MSWFTLAAEYLAPGWVGSIIGIISLVLALILYSKSRQRTDMSYSYRGDRLLGLATEGLPAEITMQYRGENIPRLTKSLIVFWNSGDKTLVEEDIVSGDPLRLSIQEDGEILAISLRKSSRDVNEISITRSSENNYEAYVTFSFLDAGDGGVLEILHTSEERNPTFSGTLRGMPKGLKNVGRITTKRSNETKLPLVVPFRLLGWISTLAGIITAGFAMFSALTGNLPFALPAGSEFGSTSFIAAGALNLILGCTLLFLIRRKYPRSLHYEDLDN
jgi:hypothetical protein